MYASYEERTDVLYASYEERTDVLYASYEERTDVLYASYDERTDVLYGSYVWEETETNKQPLVESTFPPTSAFFCCFFGLPVYYLSDTFKFTTLVTHSSLLP